MWIDVSEFHSFYNSDLGALVQRVIQQKLHELSIHNSHNQTIAAYGYAIPYLEQLRCTAARLFNLMPAQMGVIHWPRERPNLTVLCEETNLPLPDQSVDKVLIIHGLEYSSHPHDVLRECWRILTAGGKLYIVVPNRRGIWARTVSTPFGHGQPYTGYQLYQRLEQSFFTPEKLTYGLYTPPAIPNFFNSVSDSIERFGREWSKKLGGVVILQARKTVLAAISEKAVWQSRIFIPPQLEPKPPMSSTFNEYCLFDRQDF